MEYKAFIIISSLLCATNSFDMKYSLQKHEWNGHIPKLVADDTIDNYDRLNYHRSTKETVSLKATDLAGGVTLSDAYILVANFEIRDISSSCLFSIERKNKQKLALCLEPAGEDAAMITFYSANIPDGKMSFGYKILKNKWTELILAVNKTDIALLTDCEVYNGETQFKSKIYKQIHLTDDMELSVGFPLTSGKKFAASIQNLDLYSPADPTTIMTICPDFHSSQLRGEQGEKGDKGDTGRKGETGPKGETGSKGDAGECRTLPMGIIGPKGFQGDMGRKGEKGEGGYPGIPGFNGVPGQQGSCKCTGADISSILESKLPEIRGSKGEMGPIGAPGLIGVPGIQGEQGKSIIGPPGPMGPPGYPGPAGPSCPAANVVPASTDEHDALKAIASGMKILTDHITEKTEQLKLLNEHITKSNERIANAERNIEALKNAMLSESQL